METKTCACECTDANCHADESTDEKKACGCCGHCDCADCGQKVEVTQV